MPDNKPIRIVQLQAENLKRLQAVEITPDGAIVEIAGQNGAGKSSVLDAITYALAGKAVHPDRPIRDGATDAKVVVDLGDLIVTRTWTAKGTYLKVTAPDGASYGSGQAVLDKMVGALTFDPLAFSRQRPADQAETLKRVAGIDFDQLDTHRRALFEQRTDTNRDLKRALAQFDQMPEPKVAHPNPGDEISVADLLEQRREMETVKQAADAVRDEARRAWGTVGEWENKAEAASERVAELEQELVQARAHQEECEQKHADCLASAQGLDAKVGALVDPAFDELDAKLATADAHNRQVREDREKVRQAQAQRDQRQEQQAHVTRLQDMAAELTGKIDAIDQQKQQALADAKLPIEGLAFDDGGVTFHGIPFNQLSSAEQLRVSAAMAAATNPRLRVMLIREGALLDEQSMRMLGEFATEHGHQVWVERVGAGSAGAVVIEDGRVAMAEASGGAA